MKIFLDTNVLIAAFLSNGLCHELFEYCVINHNLFTSEFVLDEFREKFEGKFKVARETSEEAIALIREQAEVTVEGSLTEPVSSDPDDDHILAAAFEARCDVIITGDKDLLVLLQYQDISIVTPREFFDAEIADYPS